MVAPASETYPTYSWPEINLRFRGPALAPMLNFVEQLASSTYAAGLFPATSMNRLILIQTPEWSWLHERLCIDFDPIRRKFRFELIDQPRRSGPRTRSPLSALPSSPPANWTREYAVADAFPALIRFLHAKRWIAEYRPNTD